MTQMAATPSPLVSLDGGQVAVVLDHVTLAQLGVVAAAPAAAPDEDALFERALVAQNRRRTKKTKDEYRRHFGELKRFLAGQCDGRTPVQASEDDIVDFFAYMQSEARIAADSTGLMRPHALSASKMRSVRAALNCFYRLCQKKRYRYDNPVEDLRVERPKPKRGLTLSDEEVRKLLKAPGDYPRCEVQCYMLHFTGARTESLRYQLWRDIDFANDEIHLDRAKGDKGYTLPLHPELKAALLRWRSRQQEQAERQPAVVAAALADPDTAYVLLTREGKRLSHSTIAKQYKWRAKRAGVKLHGPNAAVSYENKSKVSPHAARRTVGTSLRRNGTDLADVADVLDHSELQTTRDHYAFSSTPQKKKVLAQLRY